MSKRKFQTEMDAALAPVLPYLTPEKPKDKEEAHRDILSATLGPRGTFDENQ